MRLAQAFPILRNQGSSVEEHSRLVLCWGADHIRNVGVNAIAIEVYRARGLCDHERGRGEGDHRIDSSQRARLRRVEDVHLRIVRERVRVWRVGRCHEGISHHDSRTI